MALTGGISRIYAVCRIDYFKVLQHVSTTNATCMNRPNPCVHSHRVLFRQCRRFTSASHPQEEKKQTLAQVCKKEKIAHRTAASTSSSSSTSSDSDFDDQGRRKTTNNGCLLLSENCRLLACEQLQLLEEQREHSREACLFAERMPQLPAPCERARLLLQEQRRRRELESKRKEEMAAMIRDTYYSLETERNTRTTSTNRLATNRVNVTSTTHEDVSVEYCRGLPVITVPLPSRRERCKFTLKPITNNVGDLISMLKHEDRGIDRVVAVSMDDTRIAASNTIENLLEEDFKLIVNDHCYVVHTPKQTRITGEEAQRLSDIKTLISQLYEALNVQEHNIQTEKTITTKLETLRQELLPLEERKIHLDMIAQRKSEWISWIGLGLMSVQFGILARLTWWEYSWDIMEPVTYFVTYGTAMVGYAYFLVTKQEYVLQDFKDRQALLTMHKKAKKAGLDLTKYNTLKEQISQLERDLYKLKNPLKLHMPRDEILKAAAAKSSTSESQTTRSTATN